MTRLTVSALAILAASALANADQPWPRHAIDNTSRGADGVRLADFNGDGRPDITTGWEEGGLVRLYLHPGRDNVHKPWPRVTVGKVKSPEDAVPLDVDGDGAMDIVSSCEGSTRTVYVHWAPKDRAKLLDADAWRTEPFPQTAGLRMWMFALPLQLDGARGVDLVVGSKGKPGGIAALLSPEDPRDLKSWKLKDIAEMGWIMSLQAHDCDGDNDLDVLISNRRNPHRGVFWLRNSKASEGADEGVAHWKLQRISPDDREMMFLARGDVTGDGRPDLVVADRASKLLVLEAPENANEDSSKESYWAEHEIEFPQDVGLGKAVALGDVNRDGRADIVFSCGAANGDKSGVRWLSRDEKTGEWVDHEISGPAGIKFDRIELLDLDDDGDLDMLTCEEQTGLGVIWYENPTR